MWYLVLILFLNSHVKKISITLGNKGIWRQAARKMQPAQVTPKVEHLTIRRERKINLSRMKEHSPHPLYVLRHLPSDHTWTEADTKTGRVEVLEAITDSWREMKERCVMIEI